ncbi:MAG: NACHT domain-containing protein, partial [Cyanobacteria bacterium P01_F01_bin.53]
DKLKMIGITNGSRSYRNFLYECIFGSSGPLRLLPTFLQIKKEYREIVLKKARAEFSDGILSGLSNRVLELYSIKISTDTIRRILRGANGAFNGVEALCKYAEVDWFEATNSLPHQPRLSIVSQSNNSQIVSDTNAIVARACRNIYFPFEVGSSISYRACQWLKSNFIELDIVAVELLPSQYPASKELLLKDSNEREDEFDRLGFQLLYGRKTNSTQILENSKKIYVYGYPGSGKSSYLKWVAIQCRDRVLLKEYVPLFLEMRHFSITGSGKTLITFLEEMFEKWGISRAELLNILSSGRGLFIIDGLDETRKFEQHRHLDMVSKLIADYDNCRFILSSRLAFDLRLPQVQKVIISPFSSRKHIPAFISKWFSQPGKDAKKAEIMLEKLRSPRHRSIREISRTPVLLELLCRLFEKFDEFPTKRADVFRSSINHLVLQSDNSVDTGIKDFPELRPKDINNILCRIATYFFIDLEGQVLFHIRDVERIIETYYADVYNIERAIIDGEYILNMIEQFNGLIVRWAQNLCAFSHLTFQEYFVAQYLVDRDEQADVYRYLTHPRWPFIIELVAELLPKEKTYDFFHGFKVTIDSLISRDEELTKFLEDLGRTALFATYASGKSNPFTQVLIRAWYLVYAIGEYTDKVDGFLPSIQTLDLPDMAYATSLVSNYILDLHEILYDAYHCVNKENSGRLKIQIYKLIQLFESNDLQEASILKTWLTQINNEQAQYSNRDEWWQDKRTRQKWQVTISRLMDRLGIPYIFGLTSYQVSLLKKYYAATYLFSHCMTRATISEDQHMEFANSMLLLTHYAPPIEDKFIGF